jgi:integrase
VSLYKRCDADAPAVLADGTPNPVYCAKSPACDHPWHYDFRVNSRRYRASTETANKGQARNIEATERTAILNGKHGIRKQPDLSFKEMVGLYLRDYATGTLSASSLARDREILTRLADTFGGLLLKDLTGHRIEQWKRERLDGRWKAHGQKKPPKPVKPGTVNRELDTLRLMLNKAVEWRKLLASPCTGVKRFKVKNGRTRILTPQEETRLLSACPTKLKLFVRLALATGARAGELLRLTWADVSADELVLWETKNGEPRRLPLSSEARAVLAELPRRHPHLFTNAATARPYTVNGLRHVYRRACVRAGLLDRDLVLHTLRHTAISRMIAAGFDLHTVMELSGHKSHQMLKRYSHPTVDRKRQALEAIAGGHNLVTTPVFEGPETTKPAADFAGFLKESSGGRQEARTPDLRVANAALSQLS